jgi:hypothetical protein
MMRILPVTLALLVAGCFAPDYHNGNLRCASDDPKCPEGLHCASDGTCWMNGSDPENGGADLLASDDGGDLSPSPDLSPQLSANGASCMLGSTCASGHCVDGLCCDLACTGQCEACDLTASPGMCKPVSGPPHGMRTACTNPGTTCGGVCDGVTAASCTYPPASTICGAACDGHCSGAGACSSTGGACPNGFACGAGTCKTTCSGPADCQTNFTCNAPSCVRIAESDCLDGLDNNGDGLTDCADPTCIGSKVICVASAATAPLGIVAASCPVGYGATHINQGFTIPSSCHGCGCTASGSCSFAFYGDQTGNGCVNPNFFLGTLSSSSTCFSLGAPMQYYSVYVADTASATCGNSQTGVADATSYSTQKNFCASPKSTSTAGCTAGQLCVAKPSPVAPVCALAVGGTCPTGYTASPTTYYADGVSSDNRSCSCSGCTVTSNGTCGVGGLSYIVHSTSNTYPLCTDNPAPYTYCGGSTCCQWNSPGTTNDGYWAHLTSVTGLSAHALPANSGASCSGGTGTVNGGTATPGSVMTVCCP